MKRGSNTFVLIIAILAFMPVFAVDFIVDGYVRREGTIDLQRALNSISAESQSSIYDGLEAVDTVVAGAPSLCTPTFIRSLHSYMLHSEYVHQMVVENANGVQYCDAFEGDFSYLRRSRELAIPGRNETVSAVQTTDERATTFFKISRAVGNGNTVGAFVQFPSVLLRGALPERLQNVSYLRVALSDGTELMTLGDTSFLTETVLQNEYLVANAFAGDLPIRVEAAIPFQVAQIRFADLYFVATLVSCAISAALLLIVFQVVRRGKVPDFDLERAIVNGEIMPYYQPVFDLVSGKIVGCEMLARWIKPNGKVISPAAFIDYAEVTGLAIPMTLQLMEQVRSDLSDMNKKHPGLKISINLFEGHFRDGNIIEDVQAIFGGSSISYRQLVFEITERHPLGDEGKAAVVIAGLRALGARFAMDDLGTGHSNLAYLQKLGLDIVKIDRVFVEMIDNTEVSAPVLEGLIKMGQELGADLIAEGVETEAQANFLRDRGVRQVQGYMFAPALPADQYIRMVNEVNSTSRKPTFDELTSRTRSVA